MANQLRQAQKIDTIGQLAGGIAHDFNNMLVAIQGYSDLASRHKSTPPEVRRYVQEIKGASVKAKNLTMQLLAFSRRTSMDRHPLSMNSLLAEVQPNMGGRQLLRLVRELACDQRRRAPMSRGRDG